MNGETVGQTSVLRIQSKDSISFKVEIDGFYSSDSLNVVFDFVFDSVSQVYGDLALNVDSGIHVDFEAILSPGFIVVYELTKIGNHFIVLPFLKTPLIVDSLSTDTLVPLEFNVLLDSNNSSAYTPIIVGCSPPNSNFDEILDKIVHENFSFRKEIIITDALNRNCFRVEQLVQILEEIEYEDKRIEFLKLAYQHAYDLNNFEDLRSLFFLDKFQRIFDEFLAKQIVD